jgi:hypothetical protein
VKPLLADANAALEQAEAILSAMPGLDAAEV